MTISLLEPLLSDFKPHSVAWYVQLYIEDMSKPGMRGLGVSSMTVLRLLQRSEIGAKQAAGAAADARAKLGPPAEAGGTPARGHGIGERVVHAAGKSRRFQAFTKRWQAL